MGARCLAPDGPPCRDCSGLWGPPPPELILSSTSSCSHLGACVCIGQPFPAWVSEACAKLSAGATHPVRGVVRHLWGPSQLLCEAWSQEHLLHCCSSAIISSRQGMQSPHLAGRCTPQPPFLAGKVLSSLLFRNLVQQLNFRLFFRVCGW